MASWRMEWVDSSFTLRGSATPVGGSKEGRRLVLREGGANLGDEVWGTAVDGINDARVIYRFFLNLYSMPTERAKLTSVWVTLVVELAL
jgi:hypothetical protein